MIVAGAGGGYSCSYSAVNAGGYSASGTGGWRVSIKRGGVTIEAKGTRDPSCADTGFIRPGDEVTAWADPVGYNRISVGDDIRC